MQSILSIPTGIDPRLALVSGGHKTDEEDVNDVFSISYSLWNEFSLFYSPAIIIIPRSPKLPLVLFPVFIEFFFETIPKSFPL